MSDGVGVVIVGSQSEEPLIAEIASGMEKRPVVKPSGTLPQLAAILKRSNLLVAGDTGPMHVAVAVGTRVVGLFGATDPARIGPIGEGHVRIRNLKIPCVPCDAYKTCKNSVFRECMEAITVEEVYLAALSILEEKDPDTIERISECGC